MTHQIKAELRQLPLMLGKLLGGIAAVIGFTAAVMIMTRSPGPALESSLPLLLLGCAGLVIFVLSARVLTRRLSIPADDAPLHANKAAASILSWGLLLLFTGIFLACTYFLTR